MFTWTDVFRIVGAASASVAIAAAVIFGLSNWLGKVWAQRILQREQLAIAKDLEATKQQLEKYLSAHNDKVAIYRAVVDIVSKLLAALDSHYLGHPSSSQDQLLVIKTFNEQRLQVYGYLAMLAPQEVMDAFDRLMDYLLRLISNGCLQEEWHAEWGEIRNLALGLINQVRIDIGIDKTPVAYRGIQ